MLSQTFTADNFREILDRENRKGKNLEPKFFPEVEKVTKKLNKIKLAFRELKKNRAKLLPDEYEKQRLALDEEKRQLKTMKMDQGSRKHRRSRRKRRHLSCKIVHSNERFA